MTRAKPTLLLSAFLFVTACSSTPQALNDNMVIPGERVGEIEIGMSLRELLAMKGTPRRTIPIEGSAATTYFFDGITVAADDQVYWIIAKDNRFRTPEGVAPGVEQIFARASYGTPDCVVTAPGITVYDYGNFYFDIDNSTGKVRQIGVQGKTAICDG